MLFITDLKVAVEMPFEVQRMIGQVAGHVEWLGMIKQLHALFWHAFYLFAELCRFTPRYLRRHLVELAETVPNNRPKLVFCIVGNRSGGTHTTCAFHFCPTRQHPPECGTRFDL